MTDELALHGVALRGYLVVIAQLYGECGLAETAIPFWVTLGPDGLMQVETSSRQLKHAQLGSDT